jgi:FkbM family methyltransferase
MKKVRHLIGRLPHRAGYELKPAWKGAAGDLNVVELAAAALASAGRLDLVLQIGAFDGESNDPLAGRVLNSCRRAVLVEPQPAVAARLRRRHEALGSSRGRIMVVEAAVSDVDGHARMFADAPDSPRASLLPGHQARFARSGSHGFTVETMRPQTLLSRFSLPVPDLLQVDAEGMDWRIVRQFFDAGMLPMIVNFEHLHLPRDQREEARARLSAEGYSWCEHGWDTTAVLSARFFPHGGGAD